VAANRDGDDPGRSVDHERRDHARSQPVANEVEHGGGVVDLVGHLACRAHCGERQVESAEALLVETSQRATAR
jgi:hypothetical protein